MSETQIARQALALSDQLQREWAQTDTKGRGWLLIDPSPLIAAERDAPWLNDIVDSTEIIRIPQIRAELPKSMYPVALPLDTNCAQGSDHLLASLQVGLAESQLSELQQGRGRAISAWIVCSQDTAQDAKSLKAHLGRMMFFRRPDLRIQWLRWYDPAVLWSLWGVLTPEQRKILFGPIRCIWLLDPVGQLIRLQVDEKVAAIAWQNETALNPLGLSADQWQRIDAIGPFNQALVRVRAYAVATAENPLSLTALAKLRDYALNALGRAQQRGIHDAKDLTLYAELAMRCHPEFDTHPLVANALDNKTADTYFSACIADIDDAQWQRIGDELRATTSY